MVVPYHLMAWSRVPDLKVVAICDRDIKKALARIEEFPGPKAYCDVAMMLDQERPDALDIAVPVEAHAEVVRMAAERDIHILCQKPMTLSFPEAEKLVAEVGEKVRFMVHENWRFRPQYRQAAMWIAEEKTGPISEFRLSTRSSGLLARTEGNKPFALERQPFLARIPRFIIFELLIHHLDTIRFLVGEMSVVGAKTAHVSPEVIGEDVAVILLKAENGAIGTVSGNFSAGGAPPLPRDRLEIVGERSSILFDNETLTITGETNETVDFNLDEAYQSSYNNAIAHFAEALRTGQPFETDRFDNLETMRLVDDAYRFAGI
jgi:predicted dehydrogenase